MTSSPIAIVRGPSPLCLSPFILPKHSAKPRNGLKGVSGELRDTNEGGDVNEAGASTVKVRSSEVKFDARSVKT